MGTAQPGSAVPVVWFEGGLRVEDHEPLWRAARSGAVLPLCIVEPGFRPQPDAAGWHWSCLRETLAGPGQPLVVRHGDAVSVLRGLVQALPVRAAWSQRRPATPAPATATAGRHSGKA